MRVIVALMSLGRATLVAGIAVAATGFATAAAPQAPYPMPCGVVAWFDGSSTQNLVLSINNLQWFGNESYGPGFVGASSFYFDGVSGAQIRGAEMTQAPTSFTVEFFARLERDDQSSGDPYAGGCLGGCIVLCDSSHGFGDGTGFAFAGSAGTGRVHAGIGDGSLFYQGDDSDSFSAVFAPGNTMDDEWHHYAATYDEHTQWFTFYLDGAEQGRVLVDYESSRRALNLGFWRTRTGIEARHVTGWIDELCVYLQALTPGTIRGIYRAGSAGKTFVSVGTGGKPTVPRQR
ncbi:MAG: LamG-like jellyroll fold domain-containing protein [Planctomycetota bacterium]